MIVNDEITYKKFVSYEWSIMHLGEENGKLPNIRVVVNFGDDPDLCEACIENWSARTDDYTDTSLCAYINSKRLKGLTDHYAFTEEQFTDLLLYFKI